MKRFAAFLLALMLLLTACSPKSASDPWQEQYDLGMKYLGEGSYAQAIEAFTAAIAIDPAREEAYTQRAEAYVRLARQLSDFLSGGKSEFPQLPDDDDAVIRGLANPEIPTDPPQQTAPSTAPGEEPSGSTDPSEESEAPTDPGTTEPSASQDPTDSPVNRDELTDEQTERLWQFISKYLEFARKDYLYAKELSPGKSEFIDEKLEDMPSDDELIPGSDPDPDPDPHPDLTSLIDKLDYAMLLAALEGMGCTDLQWDAADLDLDGRAELIVQATATIYDIPSQLTFDLNSGTALAFTATGAAQSSQFWQTDSGRYGFYTGYHTAGNVEDNYYLWNGTGWNLTDGSAASFVYTLSCPTLSTVTSTDNFNTTCVMLENDYMARDGYLGSIRADFDSDGLDEQVYLLRYAGRGLLSSLRADNSWGDEVFLNSSDNMGYAITVSQSGDTTLVTVSRIDIPATDICYTEGDALVIGDVYHYYNSETHTFGSGEMIIADNILDFAYFLIAIPDSWEGRYVYEITEVPYLDGIPERFCLSFYEANEHQATGAGHLFSILMQMEGTGGVDYPDADLMGIYYYGDPSNADCLMYSVYVLYPTDVQFSEENAQSYARLREDIYPILLSFEAGEYTYFHSYYTDTH